MHEKHGEDGSCPSSMVFHGGHCERILWECWLANTPVKFLLSALVIFVFAFMYEALKFFRQHLLRLELKKAEDNGQATSGAYCSTTVGHTKLKPFLKCVFRISHIIQTLLFLLQIIMSYLLMLLFMIFNYWICLAVILGLVLGYFFFGWIKTDSFDSDCCH